MKNKRGIARIIEATIAVLIVLGVLLTVVGVKKVRVGQDLSEIIPPFLEEIARNGTLREKIISNGADVEQEISDSLAPKIGASYPSLNYSVRICEIDEFCGFEMNYPGSDVFAGERVVSSTLSELSPKKVKIFLWRKQ